MRAFPHQSPDQAGTVVFDHHDDRPLVEAVVPFRDPSFGLVLVRPERWVEAAFEAVLTGDFRIIIIDPFESWQDYLRSERQ